MATTLFLFLFQVLIRPRRVKLCWHIRKYVLLICLLINIQAGFCQSTMVNVNNIVYFTQSSSDTGNELWRSDGTPEGTYLLKDIVPGAQSSNPENLTNVNGTLYFVANYRFVEHHDPSWRQNGFELWKSDGTAAGTGKVRNFSIGTTDGQFDLLPIRLLNVNGILFFTAENQAFGYTLWKTDGTLPGTIPIVKVGVSAETTGTLPNFLITTMENSVYFTRVPLAPNSGVEQIWKTDGTPEGTQLVKDVSDATSLGEHRALTPVNNTLYFVSNDKAHGYELWKSDGTLKGTMLLKDIVPGGESSYPGVLAAVNGILYFNATSNNGNRGLWKSDGTEAGTILVKSGIETLYGLDVKGVLYFIGGASRNTLYTSDGTPEGTVPAFPNTDLTFSPEISYADGTLFFSAYSPAYGWELWKSKGREEPTLVKDIYPGMAADGTPNSSSPSNFLAAGNLLYFTVSSSLWRTDGTSEGTITLTSPTFSCDGTGTILREYWSNIPGTSTSALPLHQTPDLTTQLTSFETPGNLGNNYGQRIRGYLCPPATGSYTFYIASDNQSELWLSTDEDPANKTLIASVKSITLPREWHKYPSQRSATITLTAGKKYYIEALHKEAGGGDHLAVAWKVPFYPEISVIPGSVLSPVQEAETISFYRAINFNGPAVDFSTHFFEEGNTAAYVSYTGRTFHNPTVHLFPEAYTYTPIINSSLYSLPGRPATVAIGNMSKGVYDIYLYVWEDNNPEVYNLAIEGITVEKNYTSGIAGSWAKLGPFRMNIADGVLNLTATGGAANLSGIEIYAVRDPTACTGTGRILREYWANVPGTAISAIPLGRAPDVSSYFFSAFEFTSIFDLNNYAQRFRGYVCPPATGSYTFYIASDNQSELWLSTDEDPANKTLIASVRSITSYKQWDKYPSQRSISIFLTGGKRYYIEALHKEGGGGDHFAVGWKTPISPTIRVIPRAYLSPLEQEANTVARLGAEENTQARWQVYPNPFTDKVQLETKYTGHMNISLTDLLGRTIYTSVNIAAGNTLALDFSELSLKQGLYLLVIQTGDGTRQTIRISRK